MTLKGTGRDFPPGLLRILGQEIAFRGAGRHHCDRYGCDREGTEPGRYWSSNYQGWVHTWFCRNHIKEEQRR